MALEPIHPCVMRKLKARYHYSVLTPNSFAPLQVPRQRRIQTATVAIWSLMLPICFILFLFLWYVHIIPAQPLLTAPQFDADLLAPNRSVPYLGVLL